MANDILWSICVQTNSARFDYNFYIALFFFVCMRVTGMCLLLRQKPLTDESIFAMQVNI